tara:strand:- start:284 stop:397 length:114 start_codon:yes stop_codon:yes gene_type:complete
VKTGVLSVVVGDEGVVVDPEEKKTPLEARVNSVDQLR